MMSGRLVWLALLLMSWVCTASRLFPHEAQVQATHSVLHGRIMGADGDEVMSRVVSRVGSRPPSCARKCGGCVPCEAIQVPTITDRIGPQYANYEPEGWKCKCGAAFFNP